MLVKFINYTQFSDGLYALIKKPDNSFCLAVTGATNLEAIKYWNIVTDNLETKVGDDFNLSDSLMVGDSSSDANSIYFIDREKNKLIALNSSIFNQDAYEVYDLPRNANNPDNKLQTQGFYSHNSILYLAGEKAIEKSVDNGKTWNKVSEFNANPLIIRSDGKVMIALLSDYKDTGNIYIADLKDNNFKGFYLKEYKNNSDPYGICFNNYTKQLIYILYKDGTVQIFEYVNGVVLLVKIGQSTIDGFNAPDVLEAKIYDSTRFGSSAYIGVVKDDTYSSIQVNTKYEIKPEVTGKLDIKRDSTDPKTTPKLTVDLTGCIVYLTDNAKLYASSNTGQTWADIIDINLNPSPISK